MSPRLVSWEAASDASTAENIDKVGSESQAAVDRRIEGVAVDIIKADPSIKAMAAALLGDAIADESLVAAMPGIARPDDEVVIGDEAGSPSWMRAGKDGMPSSYAAEAMSLTAGVYRGPVRPTFFPAGKSFTWFVTDIASGELLDIRNEVGP